MRRQVTREKLRQFMEGVAEAAESPGKIYFTGGATALLLGFREQTIDVDIKLDPEPGGVFEKIAELKEKLEINVELASPGDFIPAPPDWREKSRLIAVIGAVQFFHYDFSLQALSKVERGLRHDLEDVRNLIVGGFVTIEGLKNRFSEIETGLLRYPAIDAKKFKESVDGL
jgi:hypothetical protein